MADTPTPQIQSGTKLVRYTLDDFFINNDLENDLLEGSWLGSYSLGTVPTGAQQDTIIVKLDADQQEIALIIWHKCDTDKWQLLKNSKQVTLFADKALLDGRNQDLQESWPREGPFVGLGVEVQGERILFTVGRSDVTLRFDSENIIIADKTTKSQLEVPKKNC